MIRHIVMFRLKDEIDGTPKREILSMVQARALALKEQIPLIRRMEVHVGAAGQAAANFDLALICDFDDMAALAVYRDHPAHVAFRGYITPMRESRACIDYEL